MSVCISLSISLWSLLTSHYEKTNTQKTPASVMDPVFTDFLPRCVLSLSLSLSRRLFVLILPPAVEKVRWVKWTNIQYRKIQGQSWSYLHKTKFCFIVQAVGLQRLCEEQFINFYHLRSKCLIILASEQIAEMSKAKIKQTKSSTNVIVIKRIKDMNKTVGSSVWANSSLWIRN